MTTIEPTPGILTDGPTEAQRRSRLAEGADRLASVRRSILEHPRFLMALSAALMTAGVSAILLGWYGASRSVLIEEQVPYLISGGLLGVALSTIGAFLLFTHWLTVAIKEARQHEAARRADHAEMMQALRALQPPPAPPRPARASRR